MMTGTILLVVSWWQQEKKQEIAVSRYLLSAYIVRYSAEGERAKTILHQ
jgi:hypothetical protein